MVKYFAILCMAIGLMFLMRSAKKSKFMKRADTKKIKAIVIQNDFQAGFSGMSLCFPVYEYVINDETKQYKSKLAIVQPIPIGTETILYCDPSTNKIIESSAPVADTALAMIFGALATVLMILSK
jgi:hypothetical protein